MENEQEIADCFNGYFAHKIQKLEDSIDPEYICDPLEKLKKRHANNVNKFSLKKVSQKKLAKIMKKM